MSAAKKLTLLLIAFVLLSTGYAFYRSVSLPPFRGLVSGLDQDLSRPDALIRTYSLSRLPPDLLKLPLARDVLTEDFVAYYEHNESRLSLAGTLRRIAYEHKLDWSEQLFETAFDESAEVALWRDGGGKLKYFAVVMTRNALSRAIQLVLPALPDVQLRSAGKLLGRDAEILVLEYGYHHRLAVVAQGDRVVALSDPGMLFETDGARTEGEGEEGAEGESRALPAQNEAAAQVVARLLDGGGVSPDVSPGVSPFAEHFQLDRPVAANGHELVLGARAFALGYDAFTPGLAAFALRFDDGGKWASAALLDAALSWRAADIWATLPHGASLCVTLPVEWPKFAPLLQPFDMEGEAATAFVDRFTGPAAVCWYQDARLYTPVFAAQLKANADEAVANGFFALAKTATRVKEEGSSTFDAQTGIGEWRGEVRSRYGWGENRSPRVLQPALGIVRKVVLFSPDGALVHKALDVGNKNYPAIGDGFAGSDDVIALIEPEALANLLKKETFAALPPREEPVFRNAAEVYLAPRLDALARYPAQRVRITAASGAWHELAWEEAKQARRE